MAENKPKEVKMGRGRNMGPRPKLKNPGKIMGRVLAYVMKGYAVHLIVAVICIIVNVVCQVKGTLFLQTLIDDHIMPLVDVVLDGGTPDYSSLGQAIMFIAIILAVGIVAVYIQNRLMIYVSQGTLKNLRIDLFSKMERLPVRYFDTHSHGDIMSVYTNDIDALRQMLSQSLPQVFTSLITIASTLVSMIILSPVLTGVTLFMVVLMMIVTGKVAGGSSRYFIEQQKGLGKVNGYIEEMMEGQKVVKVFGREKINIDEFNKINDDLFISSKRANQYVNIMAPINAQLGNLSYVLCAVVGGVLVFNNGTGLLKLSIGDLASFLTFNKSFNMPINQISMQFNAVVMALAGAERIFALLDEEPEADEGYVTLVKDADSHWSWKHFHKAEGTTDYKELKGDVIFDGVDFGYTDEKMVLHDIRIFAKPGQKIALVGTTGAGKTTITNLLNRFYDIQDGKIRYDGININKIKKDDLRHSLGIVLQETALFSGSIKDNIRYGKLDATDEEVEAAAKLANADSFIRKLPEGYDTVIKADGGALSQGQRQLIAIARAAIADPPVLILDEATSSIDTRTEKLVQAGMDGLMKGRTTFVIAHRLSTVRNADCIMVMEQGRIIERGTHDELIEQKGKYYSLYTGLSA